MSAHAHTTCDGCSDCHICVGNIERWGDPDGREGRIAEIHAQLDECDAAWRAGESEPITNESRLELIDELDGLNSGVVR